MKLNAESRDLQNIVTLLERQTLPRGADCSLIWECCLMAHCIVNIWCFQQVPLSTANLSFEV